LLKLQLQLLELLLGHIIAHGLGRVLALVEVVRVVDRAGTVLAFGSGRGVMLI